MAPHVVRPAVRQALGRLVLNFMATGPAARMTDPLTEERIPPAFAPFLLARLAAAGAMTRQLMDAMGVAPLRGEERVRPMLEAFEDRTRFVLEQHRLAEESAEGAEVVTLQADTEGAAYPAGLQLARRDAPLTREEFARYVTGARKIAAPVAERNIVMTTSVPVVDHGFSADHPEQLYNTLVLVGGRGLRGLDDPRGMEDGAALRVITKRSTSSIDITYGRGDSEMGSAPYNPSLYIFRTEGERLLMLAHSICLDQRLDFTPRDLRLFLERFALEHPREFRRFLEAPHAFEMIHSDSVIPKLPNVISATFGQADPVGVRYGLFNAETGDRVAEPECVHERFGGVRTIVVRSPLIPAPGFSSAVTSILQHAASAADHEASPSSPANSVASSAVAQARVNAGVATTSSEETASPTTPVADNADAGPAHKI